MLSDVFSVATNELDRHLTDQYWRQQYSADIIARADVLRASLEAMRGLLEALPETAGAIDQAIAGDTQALEDAIALMSQQWYAQRPPNLNFSPSDFKRWALAAVVLLQAIDTHLVPLLPQIQPLVQRNQD